MPAPTSFKSLGFFRELSYGEPDGPSLLQSRRDAPQPHEDLIVDYLGRGTLQIASPGPVWDVIDGSGPIGTASCYTDGEWLWPGDLRHYVSRYHVALPEEFVARVVQESGRKNK